MCFKKQRRGTGGGTPSDKTLVIFIFENIIKIFELDTFLNHFSKSNGPPIAKFI